MMVRRLSQHRQRVVRHAEPEQARGRQRALAQQRQRRRSVRWQVSCVHLLQQPREVWPLLLRTKIYVSRSELVSTENGLRTRLDHWQYDLESIDMLCSESVEQFKVFTIELINIFG